MGANSKTRQSDAEITETSITENDELIRIKSRNELILQAAGEGIYGLDCEGITTFVNPAAAQMLGWESEELIGQPMHSLLHHSRPDGAHYPKQECPIYAAFKDGAVHHVDDEVFWRKDGSSFPVEYTSTPIHENSKLAGAVVVFKDVSERKQTEDVVRRSEERFHRLFEYSADALFLVDPAQDARIIDCNQKACDLLAYTRKELTAMHISDVHPHEIPKFLAFAESVMLSGSGQTGELSCLTSKGHNVPAEISASVLIEDEGRQLILTSVRDITERIQAEQALMQAHAEVKRMKERLEAENVYLQEEIRSRHNFKDIIGQSDAIQQVLKQIELVAPTYASVLIMGESGTGKELFARAIHERSDRHDRPLIRVNCAAIPHELFESEFFGHIKGAFTGAVKNRAGRFELADGGTIFLDEVGEIPLELQSKLLRVLQEGQYERVGDEKTCKVDVRVIAATNRDLAADVEAGKFRQDLFFRLNVFPLEAIPLRNRAGDTALLAQYFIEIVSHKLKRKKPTLTQANVEQLQAYDWPGNIRELQNVIERAIIVSQNERLEFQLPGSEKPAITTQNETAFIPPASDQIYTEAERLARDKANIEAALQQANGKISGKDGAAELLGMKSTTLASRMKKLGIQKP